MQNRRGFTLIELSIVLVIIGLIVGGVLVGQNLIASAEVRAQLTQIEKYNGAVNTFRSKYGALAGDMTPTVAAQFGFTVGAGCDGVTQSKRNGDGLLDGWSGSQITQRNENLLFWADLSAANLIDGTFPGSGAAFPTCAGYGGGYSLVLTAISEYLPVAKIGRGNFVYVYESNSINWYGISAATRTDSNATLYSSPVISVAQAYKMDAKIDDGLPQSGNVLSQYINASTTIPAIAASATSDNTTSCYNTTTGTYSVTYNNGNGGNCALSFKLQ